jgi:calcineurin-like phosphoesterase
MRTKHAGVLKPKVIHKLFVYCAGCIIKGNHVRYMLKAESILDEEKMLLRPFDQQRGIKPLKNLKSGSRNK